MKRLFSLMLVLLLVLAGNVPASADARSDYESYLSAYNAYRNAVNEGRPASEVQGYLNAYKAAKALYEGNLNKATNTATALETGTATEADTVSEAATFVATGEGERSAAVAQQQLPTGLRRILEQLWSEKGRKDPDQAMKLLAGFIESSAGSKYADLARYELAKAYELLKDDVKTASTLLAQIGRNDPNSKLALLAKERINYLAAGQKHLQWKNALNATYGVSQAGYEKYRNTSWLAFPVKVTRWFGYAGKMLDFNKTQSDFEKFQVWYEEMGSRFAPSVDVTFDKFKVANGNGNELSEISLFYSNSKAWYSRWKCLEEAKSSIDIQYFIMEKDIFGYSLLGMLLKKAQQDVKIRLLLDARGTKQLTRKLLGQDFLQELSEFDNVEIKVFNPVHTNLLSVFTDPRKLIASNHDKIVVVDEEISIIGGRNVSMDYFLEPEDHPGAYRDCDVVVKSTEVAKQLDSAFDEEFAKLKSFKISKELWGNIDIMSDPLNAAYDTMYNHMLNESFVARKGANKKYLTAAADFMKELSGYGHLRDFSGFDPFASAIQAPVKIIDKHSLGGPRNDITDQMIKYIDGCKREILLQNPYVVLTERMFNALKRAGKRGIPIIMHTNSPASTDSLATQAMFYADWKRIFKEIPGIKIYVYKGSNKLHAKNWVFDRKIGVVGTYNLDYLSEQVNSEVVAAVKSAEFSKELRDGIFSDIAKSAQYQVNINEKGEVESVLGPDDLQGKKFWLLKTLSKFTIFKKLI